MPGSTSNKTCSKSSSSSHTKHKTRSKSPCPKFPICQTTAVSNTTPIQIFNATPSPATLSISIPLLFSSSLGITVAVTAGPCILITTPPVTLPVIGPIGSITFSFCCTGTTTCATSTTSGALMCAPLICPISLAGLPLIGAVPSSISSTCPVVSSPSVTPTTSTSTGLISKCFDTAAVSGTITETLSFTGVFAPLPTTAVTELATDIAAGLLTSGCFAATTCTVTPLLSLILSVLGIPVAVGASVSILLAALAPFITPSITTAILAALANATTCITLPNVSFPFSVNVTDRALRKIDPCREPLCATASATFVSAAGASVTVTNSTMITVTPNSTCLDLGAPLTSFTIGDILPLLGITPGATMTTLPSTFCSPSTTGGCTAVVPAITKTDNVSVCVNHGKACCCGPNVIGGSALPNGVASTSFTSFNSLSGLNGFNTLCCDPCNKKKKHRKH